MTKVDFGVLIVTSWSETRDDLKHLLMLFAGLAILVSIVWLIVGEPSWHEIKMWAHHLSQSAYNADDG